MECPFCKRNAVAITESRFLDEPQWTIRRRRECSHCTKRFTTYEIMSREFHVTRSFRKLALNEEEQ